MSKILGIDLGTNSIGLSVRDTEKGENIVNQLDYFSSVIFESGVGRSKTGEYSYAADRTKHRSSRRLYQARKYRKWATLALLIENGYCPMTIEELDKWRKYDKENGFKREYPTDAIRFEQWIRLDFNGDGVADYTSPYQLRAELMERQFDFDDETERYKLGRAIYHIAQRRGFKSSKGETMKEQETAEALDEESMDVATELKKSEEKKSKDLVAYMQENNLKTVGCAYANFEKEGIRVRHSIYQAVRSQYKDELNSIFEFQNGIDPNSDFCKRVLSEKKHEGTVFYKRPLRSQKGLIGNCTLEPDKPRCPISHPDFEEFRAWCFINNIKYRTSTSSDWQTLSIELKEKMFKDRFLLTKKSFKFEELRKWMEKEIGIAFSEKNKTINYKDNTSVSGCPISARIKNLLGDDYRNYCFETNIERVNRKTGLTHKVSYTYEDIWHICFSAEEPEDIQRIATEKLGFDEKQVKRMIGIWNDIQQGYAMLSLKAIRNIIPFLRKGLIYSDAVMLAKVPEIIGRELWNENEELIESSIKGLTEATNEQKLVLGVVNTLISEYKALDFTQQYAYKNVDYKLDDSDIRQARQCIVETIGKNKWTEFGAEKQKVFEEQVLKLYQNFFSSSKRDYYHLPKQGDQLKQFLSDNFDFLQCKGNADAETQCHCEACRRLNKLYHPSQIEFYKPAKYTDVEYKGRVLSRRLLDTPTIGAIKNPVVMRALHILRRQINNLLLEGTVDDETRVVVETARDLNDANMRWAIKRYQDERESERKEMARIILKNFPNRVLSETDIDKALLLIDQYSIPDINNMVLSKGTKEEKLKYELFKKDVKKYELWLEQGCRCVYTGKIINITNLFDDNAVDIEHTIPRSISFDSSQANLTICDAYFNRSIKKNQLPTQLSNYDGILKRIQPWIEKVENIKDRIEFWKASSKRAADKEHKDVAIRQRHIWEMELEYWQKKVKTFTIQKDDLTDGFRNSQLVDTRIITKYAFHYLKSVFSRVEVQKGSATAEFRKMLGVQSVDEKKSREKHSHHAIDATILTLIPASSKRVKMTKLFYEIQEDRRQNIDCSDKVRELEREIKSCQIGDIAPLTEFVENNILINHVSKDQALTPACRRVRVRGKIVLDKNGKEIWKKGDCIRGKLHGETFYGAITQAKKNENGQILRNEDGSIMVDEQLYYVTRRELKYKANAQDTGFANWEELEKAIVDKSLFGIIRGQFAEEVSFKEACAEGIYMLDKTGKKVNKIRHIRCFTTIKNPLSIKKQTYLSAKPYKQNYYAEMGDLYVMCKYQSDDLTITDYSLFSLFDVSQNRLCGFEDIPSIIQDKKGNNLKLKYILRSGEMIVLYQSNIDELRELEPDALSKRVYVICGFENDGLRVVLQRHVNAQTDKELGRGESIKSFDQLPEKIRCGIKTLKYIKFSELRNE